MRCPECTSRNSVAAKDCFTCGFKFKRKPIPLSVKIGLAVSVAGFAFWSVAAAVVPSFIDAGHSLTRIAKNVAAGPKTPDDALKMRKDLDSAIITYLKAVGKLPANEIATKLTNELSSSAYEVHAFDLPRGLKIVEVDTLLQACDYLVINDQSSTKVQALPGMEVVEGGHVLSESGAPCLVLIGHSAGQGAKHPQVKVLALLPGDVADETGKALPDISGEGTAAFAPNNKDIVLNLSLWSVGTAEKLFSSAPNVVAHTDDENVRFNLEWNNGHYKLVRDIGHSPLSTVYAVASVMRNTSNADAMKSYLGDAGVQFAQANALDKVHADPKFSIRQLASQSGATVRPSRRHRHSSVVPAGKVAYYIAGDTGVYEINLKSEGDKWTFDSGRKLSDDQAKIALHFVNPTEINATPATVPATGTGAATVATTAPSTTTSGASAATSNATAVSAIPTIPAATGSAATSATSTSSSTVAVVPKPPAKIIVKESPTIKPDSALTTDATTKTDKDASKLAMVSTSKNSDTSTSKEPDSTSTKSLKSGNRIADALIEKYKKSGKYNSKTKIKRNTDVDPLTGQPTSASSITTSPPASDRTSSVASTTASKSSTTSSKSKNTTVTASDKSKSSVAQKPKEPEAVKPAKSHETTPPAETAFESSGKSEMMQIDSSKIKVRRGPATDYKSIAELDKGAKVLVVGKKDGWYKVKVNGKEGYVYGGLVNYQKSDAYTTATVKHTQTIADSTKKHVASPQAGDHLVVLGGIHDGKYKVQLANGKIGYVDKDSLDVKVDAPPLVP